MKKLVLLHQMFCEIGGIETFIFNFCKTFYKDYDITLITSKIDAENALRISDYADIICNPPNVVECDICLITSINFNRNLFNLIKSKKTYQMIHCDFEEMNKVWKIKYKLQTPEILHISVSECAKKSLMKEYGIDSLVIENLVSKSKKIKILRLVSATRLTLEKGFDRMKKLCDLFEEYNIPYEWDVYTNKKFDNYKHMNIKQPVSDVSSIYNNYDYVVQLSDTESFCYTMYEALIQNIPVLVTPFPNAKLEIKNGLNGYLIPFDVNLSKEEVLNIYNDIPTKANYSQKGVVEKWKKLLH